MKKLFTYILVSIVAAIAWIGCKEETTVLPPREVPEAMSAIVAEYTDILTSSTDPWIVAYKPENYTDSIYIQLDFKTDQKLDIFAGYRGYHTPQTDASYTFEGEFQPVIVFSDHTVFDTLAHLYNGSQKFKIVYQEEADYFELVRSDGYNDAVFTLKKASASSSSVLDAQVQAIWAQIAFEEEQARLSEETQLKIKGFSEIESDFYFYNMKTERFSARIDAFDTVAKTLALTYKETNVSAPTSVTLNYTVYPKGIAIEPAIRYGNVVIDSIELGALEDPTLAIIKAGNTGEGIMGYMHEAPYEFTLSTDRSTTLSEYFLTVFPSYLQSSGTMSTPASAYSEALRDYIEDNTTYQTEDRYIYFIYAPSHPTIPSALFVGARNESGGIGNFRFDVAFAEQANSKIVMNPILKQVIPVGSPNIVDPVSTYLDGVSPIEGVTPVPYDTGSGYRLRLVNSVDSRVWVEYRWPNSSYWSLIFN